MSLLLSSQGVRQGVRQGGGREEAGSEAGRRKTGILECVCACVSACRCGYVRMHACTFLCACLCLSLRCHKSGMLRFISVNMHFYFFNCTYSNTWLAHSVYCTARCSAATRKRDEHVVWPRRFPSASIYRDPPSPACIRTP